MKNSKYTRRITRGLCIPRRVDLFARSKCELLALSCERRGQFRLVHHFAVLVVLLAGALECFARRLAIAFCGVDNCCDARLRRCAFGREPLAFGNRLRQLSFFFLYE